jgi:hypothetical protein
LTRAEVLALPAVVDLVTAGRALGMGRTAAYAHAAAGTFPCRVLVIGANRYRVPTQHLLQVLGLTPTAPVPGRGDDANPDEDPGAGDAGDASGDEGADDGDLHRSRTGTVAQIRDRPGRGR